MMTNEGQQFDVAIYVVHAAHLADRKQYMMALLKLLSQEPRLQVRINFMTQHDPKDISSEDIKTLVNLSKAQAQGGDNKDDPWDPLVRNMHINQVSNALKHVRCLEAIASAAEQHETSVASHRFYLVLEDDVCFTREVGAQLAAVCEKAVAEKVDGPVFLGLPSDAAAGTPVSIRPVRATFPLSLPSCESYLLRPAAARKLLAGMTPVRFVTTNQLPFAASTTNTPLLACAPNVFSDGSKVGRFVSTLNPTNRLVYNPDYLKAYQALAGSDDAAVRQAAVDLAASPVAPHPDAMHLMAKLASRRGDHAAAMDLYKKADDIYTKAGAILNGESEFLRDYIDQHKYLQTDA